MNKKSLLKAGLATAATMWMIPTTTKPIVVVHLQRKAPFFNMEFPYEFKKRKI